MNPPALRLVLCSDEIAMIHCFSSSLCSGCTGSIKVRAFALNSTTEIKSSGLKLSMIRHTAIFVCSSLSPAMEALISSTRQILTGLRFVFFS